VKTKGQKGEPIFGFSISYNWIWTGKRIQGTKEKAFFVIFMSSCPEMSFSGPKKRKTY
jgi:hypothetical protein